MHRSFALVPLLAASTVAQVSLIATTSGVDGLRVNTNGVVQSIPSGTDVSGGVSLDLPDPANPLFGSSLDLAITRDAREFATRLSVQASTAPAGMFRSFAGGDVRLDFASPTPIDVVVEVTLPRILLVMITCSDERNLASIVGGPSWNSQSDCPLLFPDFEPCTFRHPTTIDASGLTIDITATGSAVTIPSGICPGGGNASTCVEVKVVPRAPSSSFGATCGVEVRTFGDLLDPTRGSMEIQTTPGSVLGVLLFGTTQQAIPLPGGCFLNVDNLFDIAFTPDALGQLAFSFPLPPAGLLTMQAATSDGIAIALSDGQQF